MEGKKQGDVSGLDNNLLEAAAQSKLFASNVPASAVSVPGGWDNDTFVPYDYGYFAFVYDKNKLANPPKSLKELVEARKNGGSSMKIRVPAPRDWACCCGCKVYGDQAPEAGRSWPRKPLPSPKAGRSLWSVPERESDTVLSYTAYHMIEEKKDNYAAASFARAYLQVEVAARTAASKQPELAEKFLKFMVSHG